MAFLQHSGAEDAGVMQMAWAKMPSGKAVACLSQGPVLLFLSLTSSFEEFVSQDRPEPPRHPSTSILSQHAGQGTSISLLVKAVNVHRLF
jgi:hypothetical protein